MFYTYNQNNSGGRWVFDRKRGISHYVIIEANSQYEANVKAEHIGLYFNGCDTGDDCSCCGDRWYQPWSDDGNKVPSIYDSPIEASEIHTTNWMGKDAECFIHYLNGNVEAVFATGRD